jgi:hypothetical protein
VAAAGAAAVGVLAADLAARAIAELAPNIIQHMLDPRFLRSMPRCNAMSIFSQALLGCNGGDGGVHCGVEWGGAEAGQEGH